MKVIKKNSSGQENRSPTVELDRKCGIFVIGEHATLFRLTVPKWNFGPILERSPDAKDDVLSPR